MTLRVTAGYVTVETAVPGGRAAIDIPRGAVLPSDVSADQVEALMRLGHIEAITRTASREEPVVAPVDGPSLNLDGLTKSELFEVALGEGVEVDKRWGAKKLAAAITTHRAR